MKEEKIKNQNPWEENKHSIIDFPLWKIHTKDKLKEFMMKQKQGRDQKGERCLIGPTMYVYLYHTNLCLFIVTRKS